MQVPMGQLLLQQGYLDNSTIPTQLHQSLQQQNLIQGLQMPSLEQKPALNDQTLAKPKRKQVKNACGKFDLIFLEPFFLLTLNVS